MSYEIGAVIGDYEVVQVLGTGGMGRVYKVRNTISNRIDAMKVLLPDLGADPELGERFLREIRVQASLNHPNIASLLTAQRVNNQLLMVMEFVDGSTIEQIMETRRIPLTDCINYGSQVLSALSYAHTHGIVHRDVKPPNIMLTSDGSIKLMDFGIAKINADHRLTKAGSTFGSLYYMAPEQIRGGEVDARSDLYSFGITLYEMVTGQRPFQADSEYSLMAAHLQQPPRPLATIDQSLPKELNDVIMTSIAKEPGERFQTADAFRSALLGVGRQIGAGASSATGVVTHVMPQPSPAQPVSPPPTAFTADRQRSRALWLGGVAALLALMLFALYAFRAKPAPAAQHIPDPPAPTSTASAAPAAPTHPATVAQSSPATASPITARQENATPPASRTMTATTQPTQPNPSDSHSVPQNAAAAPVADLSGRWQADVKYSWGDTHPEVFAFTVDGNEVLGTASYLRRARGIIDGKLEGNKVTFITHSETMLGDKTYEEKHHYRGRISGDTIEFMLQTESGYDDRPPETFTARRVAADSVSRP